MSVVHTLLILFSAHLNLFKWVQPQLLYCQNLSNSRAHIKCRKLSISIGSTFYAVSHCMDISLPGSVPELTRTSYRNKPIKHFRGHDCSWSRKRYATILQRVDWIRFEPGCSKAHHLSSSGVLLEFRRNEIPGWFPQSRSKVLTSYRSDTVHRSWCSSHQSEEEEEGECFIKL